MNYIKQLQAENQALKERLATVEKQCTDFLVFLHSPKFQGTESNGARKDWIATSDVCFFVQDVRSQCFAK